MKKLLLGIFLITSFATYAQQAPGSGVLNEDKNFEQLDTDHLTPGKITLGTGDKTRGPARWYDIVDAVYKSYNGALNIYANDHYNLLWSDTTIMAPYGSPPEYSGVWVKSVASYLDPVDPRYNDPAQYPGETAITFNDPYTIDSLFIPFIYTRNAAKTNVVDTLVVSVVYGDGSGNQNDLDIRYYAPTSQTASNHGTDTLRVLHGFMDLTPTSSNYHGYLASTPTKRRTIRIPLTASSENDTIVSGTGEGFNYVQVPINLNVPAGNKAAASIVFKSGDTWTPNADTLYISGNRDNPNFNNFRFIAFEEVDGGFQQYTKGVWSQSALMRNDTGFWRNRHIPCYAFNNTSYEHQWFQWKLDCPTCGPVSTVNLTSSIGQLKTYPNPASNSTTVALLAEESLNDVVLELLSINGSVISSYEIGDVEQDTRMEKEINTKGIAPGLYLIQIQADQGKQTLKLLIE
jgi:hypothetical protein